MSAVSAVMPQSFQRIAVPNDYIWRLSVEQYHEMIRAGILTTDDPVELLEGWLVVKMPKNPPHILATNLMRDALAQLLPKGWHINTQDPVTTESSEPEPDVAVIQGTRRQYSERHAGPQDLALVVEVSDSTLGRDRGLKKRVYAETKIIIYWIVNLVDNQIEVYTDPTGPTEEPDYRRRQDYGPADDLPVVIAGVEVGRLAVRDLLP